MGVSQQLVAALQSTNSPLEVGPLLISATFSNTQYVDVALAETWCLVMYLRAYSRKLSNWYFPSQNECMPQVKSQLFVAIWRELPGAYMCGWSGTIPLCLYVSLYCMFISKRWCASSKLRYLQSCYTICIALFSHFSIGYKSRRFILPLFSGTSYYWLVGSVPSTIACDLSDTETSTICCEWATCTLPRLSRQYVVYIFHKWNSLLCCECVEYCERQTLGLAGLGTKLNVWCIWQRENLCWKSSTWDSYYMSQDRFPATFCLTAWTRLPQQCREDSTCLLYNSDAADE